MMKVDKLHLNKDAFNDFVFDIIDDYSNRYEIYYGGGGSGKSFGAVSKMVLKSCRNVRTVLVIRKIKATLLNSVYAQTKEILQSLLPECGLSFIENKTDLTLSISNGSKFIFMGIDDPEKIKSIHNITDVIIEEATELTFDDFTQIDLRLRPKVRFPQIYLMFNPVSKANWCYKHWFLSEIPSSLIIKSTYRDNKFLTDNYRETLEGLVNTNQNYYKVYCLGQFATLDKLVFNNFYIDFIDESSISHLPCYVGLDFGFVNDPTAIIRFRYADDAIYIMEEIYLKGLLNSEIFDEVCSFGFDKFDIIADCAEQKSIAELKKMGLKIFPCSKGSGSILNDINMILRHKVFIDKSCKHTISEFQNYTWTRDRASGEYINKPIDKHNHLIDALRYGLQNRKKCNISVAKFTKE